MGRGVENPGTGVAPGMVKEPGIGVAWLDIPSPCITDCGRSGCPMVGMGVALGQPPWVPSDSGIGIGVGACPGKAWRRSPSDEVPRPCCGKPPCGGERLSMSPPGTGVGVEPMSMVWGGSCG